MADDRSLESQAFDMKTYSIRVARPTEEHQLRASHEGDLLSQAMEGRRCAFGFRGGMVRAGEMVMVNLSSVTDGLPVSPLAIAYARVCTDADRVLDPKQRYEVHMCQDGSHYVGFFWFAHSDFAHAGIFETLVPQSLNEIQLRPIEGGGTFLAGRHTVPDGK